MEFSTKSGSPEKRATPCIAVGVYAAHKLSASAGSLDRASRGSLREILRRGDMEGKLGATLLLYRVPGVAAERVLLVGLGTEADLRERVTMAYVAAVSAERRVAVARQLAEFANRGFSAASTRVTAGGGSPIEQQRADVERVNANVAFDRAVREAVVAKENLARLIGEPIAGELDVAWFDRVGTYGPAAPCPSSEHSAHLAA